MSAPSVWSRRFLSTDSIRSLMTWRGIGLILLSGIGLVTGGCAGVRVPEIDPTGQSLFTGDCVPTVSFCGNTRPIQPAYVAPADLADCPVAVGEPGAVTPVLIAQVDRGATGGHHAKRLPPNENLGVTPGELVAPVRSEVVLKAGLCGDDGHLLVREQLEWTLAPGSVGHFVEVGDDERCFVNRINGTRDPQKITSTYAIGRSSTHARVIDRGTLTPNDDVPLRAGEGWISMTSPTEGISRVTVVAPDARNWDQRRQTVTVYWIDAAWQLPQGTTVGRGRPAPLTTTVRRQTTGLPIAGAIVRYEVLGGSAAGFGPERRLGVELRTDPTGVASIDLLPVGQAGGCTQVKCVVARPPAADGTSPELVLGESVVNVCWESAALAVQATGPARLDAGQAGTFRAEVRNPGSIAATGVTVELELPSTMDVVAVSDTGQAVQGRVRWSIGAVQPGEIRSVELSLRPTRGGDLRLCFTAAGADGLVADSCVATQVFQNALALQVNGPERTTVGELADFAIRVTNTSDRAIENVELIDSYPFGLSPQVPNPSNPLRNRLGTIGPGQTVEKGLAFLVEQPGPLCHTVRVVGDGGHGIERRVCVEGVARPRPATPPTPRTGLRIDLTGPASVYRGEAVEHTFDVINTGEVALTNVLIAVAIDDALAPGGASEGVRQTERPGLVYWQESQLAPGARVTLQVQSVAVAVNAGAIVRVEAVSDEGARDDQTLSTTIAPEPARVLPPGERSAPTSPSDRGTSGSVSSRPRVTGSGLGNLTGPTPLRDPLATGRTQVDSFSGQAAGSPELSGSAQSAQSPAMPGRTAPPNPHDSSSTSLRLSLTDNSDPALSGSHVVYTVRLANPGTTDARDLDLAVTFTPGLRFQAARSGSTDLPAQPTGAGSVRFLLATLPAGERFDPIELAFETVGEGRQTVSVTVTDAEGGSVTTKESTDVISS